MPHDLPTTQGLTRLNKSPAAAVTPLQPGYARLPGRHRRKCYGSRVSHSMITTIRRVTILPEAIRGVNFARLFTNQCASSGWKARPAGRYRPRCGASCQR